MTETRLTRSSVSRPRNQILTTRAVHHSHHHQLPMHHCQASYHLKRSVLQHLVPHNCFQTQFCTANKLTLLIVPLPAPLPSTPPVPQSTLTALLLPPVSQPPASQSVPPLPRALPLLPHPPSLPRVPTRLSLSRELPLLVFSASLLTSCKRLLQNADPIVTNVRFFLSDTSVIHDDGNSDLE